MSIYGKKIIMECSLLWGGILIQAIFLNGTILVSFITLGNQILKNHDISNKITNKSKILLGVLNGLLGCVLMLYSVKLNRDVIIDFRHLAIIMSVIFGGYISAIITSLGIGIFRIFYFGISAPSITALIAVNIMGIGAPFISNKFNIIKNKWLYSTLFTMMISTISFVILIQDKVTLLKTLITFWIGCSIVTVILYAYISMLTKSNQLFRKYKEESTKDFLTGLYNVRQFDNYFNRFSNQIAEQGGYLSILLIDIDYFKKVNDTYGHTEGDMILKEFSQILLRTSRKQDIVSRNGGEEFSILLMDCHLSNALTIAKRIHSEVLNHEFKLSNGQLISITVSIGISSYPTTTMDYNLLINDSDQALYKAKQNGRNQIIVSSMR